ncbi:MAG TPA: IS5 family transposase [Gemmatimonadaceae bacterium]|nr:IS5 family transposase [Gemmatimonadaceae bacterium]
MRGPDDQTSGMFSYLSPEQRVRPDHPLRTIRRMTDEVLATLSPRFTKMYSDIGRPSIPPEQLLRALLLQLLYTVRSERLLMEEIDYSVLYRWFIGLGMDDPIWSPTTFSKNRDRLLQSDIAAAFFEAVVAQARTAGLLSDEHFTVDGTLLEGWASLKSFRQKDVAPPPPDDPGNPTINFHGETRRNDTHQSTTDPEAKLARKGAGREAKLSYAGHVVLDNRHGLVANVCVTAATGTAEREAALRLLAEVAEAGTVGGDKGFDVSSFVAAVRGLGLTPHVAQRVKGSAIDGRTTRHAGYAVSQQKRKLIEQVFGWMKTVGGLRKLRHRGTALIDWILTFAAAAYNLVRLRTLLARPA